ncbi:MAG: amino acid ABC transporter permease [Candidatus Tectimicrobiota bacterium]
MKPAAPSPAPILPPPAGAPGVMRWLRRNVFQTWYNTLITLVLLVVLAWLLFHGGRWVLCQAHWQAVTVNLRLFAVGLYPTEALWRPVLALVYLAGLCGGSTAHQDGIGAMARRRLLVGLLLLTVLLPGQGRLAVGSAALALLGGYGLSRLWPHGRWLWRLGWWLSLPIILTVLGGFSRMGLGSVSTTQWGGLMLTLLLATIGIVASLPLGLLLALGRQSTLPMMRWFAITYIELVRGVPLVSVVMMFALLLPLFLPASWGRPDMLLRLLLGITLFTAAYVAENVRGGLQAIPRGQYEAATALGLTWVQSMRYIILPQALRAVIPALVGQCIALFKDTSLAQIVGVLELLGIAKSVLEQPEWKSITGGVVFEVFLFTALVYGLFTYNMSRLSQRLERQLGVGQR